MFICTPLHQATKEKAESNKAIKKYQVNDSVEIYIISQDIHLNLPVYFDVYSLCCKNSVNQLLFAVT